MNPSLEQDGTPWWRYPIMWLVVGAPLAVVVAGTAMAVVAIHGADAVLIVPSAALARSAAPALHVRNHVSTPAQR